MKNKWANGARKLEENTVGVLMLKQFLIIKSINKYYFSTGLK